MALKAEDVSGPAADPEASPPRSIAAREKKPLTGTQRNLRRARRHDTTILFFFIFLQT